MVGHPHFLPDHGSTRSNHWMRWGTDGGRLHLPTNYLLFFSRNFLLGKQNENKIKNNTDGGGEEITSRLSCNLDHESLCVSIDHSGRSYCVPEY